MKTLQSVPAIKGEAAMHRGAVGRCAFAGRIYRWGGVVALGAALLLPACTILPKAEPLDVYLLPATAPVSASATQAAPWSLRIARPAAGVHLSGQRIVVVPEDNRVSVYTGAGWSDLDRAMLRATDELTTDHFVTDATWAALAPLGDKGRMDLVMTVGQYTQVSMILNSFGVQVEDGWDVDPDLKA